MEQCKGFIRKKVYPKVANQLAAIIRDKKRFDNKNHSQYIKELIMLIEKSVNQQINKQTSVLSSPAVSMYIKKEGLERKMEKIKNIGIQIFPGVIVDILTPELYDKLSNPGFKRIERIRFTNSLSTTICDTWMNHLFNELNGLKI